MNERVRRDGEQVNAAVRENVWGGIGAGLVTFVSGVWLLEYSNELLIVSLLTMLFVFGVTCVWRFSLDEVRDWLDHEQVVRLIAERDSMIADQQAELVELRAENKRQAEQLRTYEFNAASRDAKDVVQRDEYAELRRNVQEIVDRWAQGVSYSRDNCTMSKSQWMDAIKFLRDAGIVVRGGAGNRQWVFVDGVNQGQVEQRIRERIARLEDYAATNYVVA